MSSLSGTQFAAVDVREPTKSYFFSLCGAFPRRFTGMGGGGRHAAPRRSRSAHSRPQMLRLPPPPPTPPLYPEIDSCACRVEPCHPWPPRYAVLPSEGSLDGAAAGSVAARHGAEPRLCVFARVGRSEWLAVQFFGCVVPLHRSLQILYLDYTRLDRHISVRPPPRNNPLPPRTPSVQIYPSRRAASFSSTPVAVTYGAHTRQAGSARIALSQSKSCAAFSPTFLPFSCMRRTLATTASS